MVATQEISDRLAAAIHRSYGLTLYSVQSQAGKSLCHQRIVEMATGEGKTLTAMLPIAYRAQHGRGVHVLTANDYLAQRDAEFAAPILDQLGLNVGCIQSGMSDDQRRAAYHCDVTYGTGSEMGFDFLRDRLRTGPQGESSHLPRRSLKSPTSVQRGHYFALVDEADNLLIDDATTPLLIGLPKHESEARQAMYEWADFVAADLRPDEFLFDAEKRQAFLTEEGHRVVALKSKPPSLDSNSMEDIYEQVETSLIARYGFQRDRDYVVDAGEVTIISESTGRQLAGRKWRRGLHFAVEAKEKVPFSVGSGTAAKISVQRYFSLYENLAGMTGTAWNARGEFKKYYKTGVRVIPTHRPCIRKRYGTRVFGSTDAKNQFIAQQVRDLVAAKRAVLIGTPSVDASELLSHALAQTGIQHNVLNAVKHDQEAEVVAEAGQSGRVTIATNMAGRGTDIKLSDEVQQAGGLHVIATEMHSSKRIDRQLIGRSARQGDPGSYQFCLSVEDELFRHNPTLQRSLERRSKSNRKGQLPSYWAMYFRRVQNQIENLNRKRRKLAFKAEKKQMENAFATGLDPYLEIVDSD